MTSSVKSWSFSFSSFFMSPIYLVISLHPTLFKCLQLRVKKASSFCCLLRENVETDCLPWEMPVWCLYMCLIACVPQSASCSEKELITHIFLLNKLKEVQRVGEKKQEREKIIREDALWVALTLGWMQTDIVIPKGGCSYSMTATDKTCHKFMKNCWKIPIP